MVLEELNDQDKINGKVAYGKTAGGALEELRTVNHVLQVSGADLVALQADIADIKADIAAIRAILES